MFPWPCLAASGPHLCIDHAYRGGQLLAQDRLPRTLLLGLDQVEHHDGGAVPRLEVVKVQLSDLVVGSGGVGGRDGELPLGISDAMQGVVVEGRRRNGHTQE